MSDTERTPGPYEIRHSNSIYSQSGKRVAWAITGLADDKDVANAQFIVTACNNFDALLAACEMMLRTVSHTATLQHPPSVRHYGELHESQYEQLKAAIKAAKGE